MSRKHLKKYIQKYQIFVSSATVIGVLCACSITRKVPDGDFLLTKNKFEYEDPKQLSELPDYVNQKPNKKQIFFLPIGLMMYNSSNPKYDSILAEYMTYPKEMRNQKLRDSLFIKNGHPEYVGKSLFWNRFFHSSGQPPVILDEAKTENSAENIEKRMVYRGYWDADVRFKNKLDSAKKKAQVTYLIKHNEPTYIDGYYYNIPDDNVRRIFENNISKSAILNKQILDQTNLEKERKRLGDLMKENGYYRFNSEDIYFTADTLKSKKKVPLVMEVHKDSLDSPYKKSTFGNVDVAIIHQLDDFPGKTEKDSMRFIRFHKVDEQYKTRALWRAIIVEPGTIYDQKQLDQTRKNLIAMNNFSIISAKDDLRNGGKDYANDSIVDVTYILKPLPKFDRTYALDVSYSRLLNLGISPSANLLVRNVFGGAENLTTGISLTSGRITDSKNPDEKVWAYEASFQSSLSFPRLLLPFTYYKLIPKRYSPTTSINLNASIQNNIGLGRINFNTGLSYFANVNENMVTHKLTLFNTQLSLTRNKDRYYDYFPTENIIRNSVFGNYFLYNPNIENAYINGQISSDDVSSTIINDQQYISTLNTNQNNELNNFRQSLINKDRQTQDVLVSSFLYNFIYDEKVNSYYTNPFYFNGTVEFAGNLLGLIAKGSEKGVVTNAQKTVFGIPYSQFVKFDLDFRKYFTFFNGKHTLALRQFIGIGIPYGNSEMMPFVRSYYNGGSNDIRAWSAFGGLGPADSQLDEKVRYFMMDNLKLTTSVEYRFPLSSMFEGAVFTDMGNIWSLKESGLEDEFKFDKFLSQIGVGSGLGLRINVAYLKIRLDFAYKMYDPNKPHGKRWVVSDIKPLKPTFNIGFGYPF